MKELQTETRFPLVPLKHAVDPSRPITYGIVQCGPDFPDGVPYIRPADMEDEAGIRNLGKLLRTDPEIAFSYRRSTVLSGDIVLSIGPSFGKVLIVPSELNGANLTQGTARVAPDAHHDSRFIFWSLRSSFCKQQWEARISGATFRALNLGPLAESLIPDPAPTQQRAIAAFLDRETERIDRLVAKKRELIERLKEKRTALISRTVTRGLPPEAAAKTGLPVNPKLKPSGLEWLGDIPMHWKVIQLRRLVRSGTTITYGIVQAGPDIEDGIPYIRTSDMAGDALPRTGYLRTTPEIDASYSRSKVRPNDLVVAIRASVGKGLLVPNFLDGANLTQGTAKISPAKSLLPRFLFWSFNSKYCQSSISVVAKGTTFLEITLEALRRIQLAVPPIPEQDAIAAYLDEETPKLDALMAKVEEAVERLQEYRTALITAAVTGKIDVRRLNHTRTRNQ